MKKEQNKPTSTQTVTEGKIRMAREYALTFLMLWLTGVIGLLLVIRVSRDESMLDCIFVLGAAYLGMHCYLFKQYQKRANLINLIIAAAVTILCLVGHIILE